MALDCGKTQSSSLLLVNFLIFIITATFNHMLGGWKRRKVPLLILGRAWDWILGPSRAADRKHIPSGF